MRCKWGDKEDMRDYHDKEWGKPVHDDRKLFEALTLDGAQAGLSWSTILNKREGYRKAFHNFDVKKVAKMNKKHVEKLMKNPDIVRNRLKIESTITNARAFIKVQEEFGSFDKYFWQFVGKTRDNRPKTMKQIPTSTKESDAMSKDMKARGFRFVGSTICYAIMQGVGMVNDHVVDCDYR